MVGQAHLCVHSTFSVGSFSLIPSALILSLSRTAASTDWFIQFVARKTSAALAGGLGAILCIGESLEVSHASDPEPR